MFLECRHIRQSGVKCRAAALREQPFCYYHTRERERMGRPRNERFFMQIPRLEDQSAIQIAFSELTQAIVDDQIDYRRATLLIRCFQGASQNARRVPETTEKTVSYVSKTDDGEELAPSVKNTTDDFARIIAERLIEGSPSRSTDPQPVASKIAVQSETITPLNAVR